MSGIYLDNNATTPCDARVVEKMLPFFAETYGNPANGFHIQGRNAYKAVNEAREEVADLIGAKPGDIYFTGGATESNNLAILGFARHANRQNRNRIVTCQIEHKAVLLPCRKLEQEGFEITYLPVDRNGEMRIADLDSALDSRTLLVSIQTANNEIGTIQPLTKIAEMAHQHGALLHTDAAQAVGKIPVNVDQLGVDLLSMSAHKLYGPKGVGALYIRGGTHNIPIEPLVYGGGQENGLRSGTTNVPGIVGFGEACRIVQDILPLEMIVISAHRDQFEMNLQTGISELVVNGKQGYRLPNTSSLTFLGVEADALLFNLPNVMLGTGSACTSGAIEPSHVLQAIGLSREDANCTVRASLGRLTTDEEIEVSSKEILDAWRSLSKK